MIGDDWKTRDEMKQSPHTRCGFCGEGLTCEHGLCDMCQACFECPDEDE